MEIVSSYNAINRFLSDLRISFEQFGFEVHYFKAIERHKIPPEEIAFVLCMNGGFYDRIRNFLEKNNILVFCLLVDKPEEHYPRISKMLSNSVMLVVDKCHATTFMKNTHIYNRTMYLPHGGSVNVDYETATEFEDRTIDVLLTGGYVDENTQRETFIRNGNVDINFFNMISDNLLADYSYSFDKALDDISIQNQTKRNTKEYTLLFLLNAPIYDYYRYKYRNETVRVLLENGIEITCYGNGWENSEFIKYPNFKYMGACSFDESLNHMTKSKITLNIMPTFKNGAHERIFNAALNGSVCLSTKTYAFKDDLVDNETILFYDLNNQEEMFEKINTILNNKEKFYEITKKARSVAEQKHTWAHRAKQILEIYDSVNVFN